jgi:hypothetical protein
VRFVALAFTLLFSWIDQSGFSNVLLPAVAEPGGWLFLILIVFVMIVVVANLGRRYGRIYDYEVTYSLNPRGGGNRVEVKYKDHKSLEEKTIYVGELKLKPLEALQIKALKNFHLLKGTEYALELYPRKENHLPAARHSCLDEMNRVYHELGGADSGLNNPRNTN